MFEFVEVIENDKVVEMDEEVLLISIDERFEFVFVEVSKVFILVLIRMVSVVGILLGDKFFVNDIDNGSFYLVYEYEDEFEGEVDLDEILLVVWLSMCCVENGELMFIM